MSSGPSEKKKKGEGAPRQSQRAVDLAMHADKDEKRAIREFWVAILKELGALTGPYPVYFTMPGAEGKDVELLVARKLILTTETGAIDPRSVNYCVAIENSPKAVLELQKRFPGLRILEQNVQSVLRGNSPLSYPENTEQRAYCQAHVINLDLQATLSGEMNNADPFFPVLRWIEKFGTLQTQADHLRWHLFLTLNATIEWPLELSAWVSNFLTSNLSEVIEFENRAKELLHGNVFEALKAGESIDFSTLELSQKQRTLLAIVPKAIIYYLSRQGWSVETRLNAEYSGAGGAPMVTYVFTLTRKPGTIDHSKLYKDSVSQCLISTSRVNANGQLDDTLSHAAGAV